MVEELEIGGKLRPLKFNNGVTRKMCADLGVKKFDELGQYTQKSIENFYKHLQHLFFYALQAGAKATGQKFEETKETVMEWLDDLTQAEIMSVSHFNIEEKKA